MIVEDEPPVCADIRNNNLLLRLVYFLDISFSSWYVHKKHVRGRNGLFYLMAVHPIWMTSKENLTPGQN